MPGFGLFLFLFFFFFFLLQTAPVCVRALSLDKPQSSAASRTLLQQERRKPTR